MKRLIIPIIIMVVFLSGCVPTSVMPYNGDIRFHEISLYIPKDFIRDSTQSDENGWVFEKNYYSQVIIMTRSDAGEDISAQIDSYMEYMRSKDCQSDRTTFRDREALLTIYTLNDQYCQELCFPHESSLYFVALRGGTEEEFQALLDTIGFAETTDSESV